MQQFKALIIKEWNTHKRNYLIPLWVLLAVYALSILTLIYGRIRYGLPSIIQLGVNAEAVQSVLWVMQFGSAVFISWICILTTLALSDATLNQDYTKRCEIFHLSQPVSLKKILGSKAVFVFLGIFLQYLTLVIVNYLMISAGMAIFGLNALTSGWNAILYTIPYYITSVLMLMPTSWFFASLFRKNSPLMMILFFAVFDIVGLILKVSWGVKLYSLLGFWSKVLTIPFQLVGRKLAAPKMLSIDFSNWATFWNQENWIWLGINIILVIVSYFIYKRRNIT